MHKLVNLHAVRLCHIFYARGNKLAVAHSLDGWSSVSPDHFAMVVTSPLVPPAVPLLLAGPGILFYYIHDPACLDDCSEIVWSVLYLQDAMQVCLDLELLGFKRLHDSTMLFDIYCLLQLHVLI